MKKFLLSLILLSASSFAIDLSQLNEPMPLEGRLSNTDKVESKKIKVIKKEEKITKEAQIESTKKETL